MSVADEYIDLGFPDNANPVEKLERFIDALENGIPDYEAVAGNPEVIIGEAAAELAADNEVQTVSVARQVFREIGINLVSLDYQEGVQATAQVTVTASAAEGGTITGGVSQVAIGGTAFEAVDDVTIAAGDDAVVEFIAIDAGTAGNDLTGTPEPITSLAWVESYDLPDPTSGGLDAEDDDSYVAKLTRRMRSIGRPVLAADFEGRVLEHPEAARVLIIDGYNADTLATGQAATVTFAAVTTAGLSISEDAQDDRIAAIEAEREIGWNVFAIDPTYTEVDVAASITTWDGFTPSEVVAEAEAAVADYLDPSKFGQSPSGDVLGWNLETHVWRTEIITLINNVSGVRRVVNGTLLLNGVDQDVALTGVAPLTEPGTIAITAV